MEVLDTILHEAESTAVDFEEKAYKPATNREHLKVWGS
jgi:hypothetical protein